MPCTGRVGVNAWYLVKQARERERTAGRQNERTRAKAHTKHQIVICYRTTTRLPTQRNPPPARPTHPKTVLVLPTAPCSDAPFDHSASCIRLVDSPSVLLCVTWRDSGSAQVLSVQFISAVATPHRNNTHKTPGSSIPLRVLEGAPGLAHPRFAFVLTRLLQSGVVRRIYLLLVLAVQRTVGRIDLEFGSALCSHPRPPKHTLLVPPN